MIKKLIILILSLFSNNIEKVLEKNITKLECSYCKLAYIPIYTKEVCKVNNKLFTSRIRDEL